MMPRPRLPTRQLTARGLWPWSRTPRGRPAYGFGVEGVEEAGVTGFLGCIFKMGLWIGAP
jgi:hypothetical protein